jgi:glycosyltransferase involved in cell wall biosynthesis
MFEALATGTPVVAAVRGEAETLLRETGAGLAVPPGDRAAMIDALRQLAAGPERRAAMSAAARAYAESALSPERVLQAYLDIFQRVAARHDS